MQMIEWSSRFLESDNTKLIYLLSLIMGANIIDFSVGWVNAKLNKNIKFSSSKAIFGIARKLLLFVLLIYSIPMALLIQKKMRIS